ncbi:MAG TPA: sialate O-acetylesterase [Roseimicrobium sp.]|nr:sialate O-acetylesterase [Roseimicrobium sp.]
MKTSFNSRPSIALFGLIAACAITSSTRADVRMHPLFSEHAVLQVGMKVPVWGWAEAGEEVTVRFSGQSVKTKADASGKWRVELQALKTGESGSLKVSGKNEMEIQDVIVGEVWLGSGQSNMAMTVNRTTNAEAEATAANFPSIRMFTVTSTASPQAKDDCVGKWEVCTPANVPRFSATAYYFGRELHKELKVPVGLINSSVGGTPIESWVDAAAQASDQALAKHVEGIQSVEKAFDPETAKAKYEKDLATWKERAAKAKAAGSPAPRAPVDPLVTRRTKGTVGGLFNGKIAPLIPYAIRGAIWYQGEANSAPGKAELYHDQLSLLIKDWRKRWGTEFPFAWVQLPNYDVAGRDWPTIREGMLKTLEVPNTGMAIAIDIGEAKDIHPKNKQEVGRRLSLWALAKVYGRGGEYSGPIAGKAAVSGSKMTVAFDHTGGGLMAKDGELGGFEVSGEDGTWSPAAAKIDGKKVVLEGKDVSKPIAARYAWENYPKATLYNKEGLPATPFRVSVPK